MLDSLSSEANMKTTFLSCHQHLSRSTCSNVEAILCCVKIYCSDSLLHLPYLPVTRARIIATVHMIDVPRTHPVTPGSRSRHWQISANAVFDRYLSKLPHVEG